MKAVDWRAFLGRNFRRFILPGAVILIGIFLLFFIFVTVLSNISAKKELITRKELELNELTSLSKQYTDIKRFNAEIDQRISKNGANFELLSFLEEMAKKIGINEKISSMKPSKSGSDEVSASLVLKNLTMDELTGYLNQIMNTGRILSVKKMHLKASDKGKRSLEAYLVISTIKSPQKHPSS